MQPLWQVVCYFLRNLNIEFSNDSAVSLLDIYPEEVKTKIQISTSIYMFIVVHNSSPKGGNNLNMPISG